MAPIPIPSNLSCGARLTAHRSAARTLTDSLKPDHGQIDANGKDTSMVAVEIQDRQGRVVPVANDEVVFKVSCAAEQKSRSSTSIVVVTSSPM